jgi:hypothetical protein
MSDTLDAAAVPTPNEIPVPNGVSLTVSGKDSNGLSVLAGLTSESLTISDPGAVFAFTPAADNRSATLVPSSPLVAGVASITYAATTTNADGTPGAAVSATYIAAITPGNTVSVSLDATNL